MNLIPNAIIRSPLYLPWNTTTSSVVRLNEMQNASVEKQLGNDSNMNKMEGEFTPINKVLNASNTANDIRILCWVMTHPKNHKSKAIHVKKTWGKRCNILLFMSSKTGMRFINVHLNNINNKFCSCWGKIALNNYAAYNGVLE